MLFNSDFEDERMLSDFEVPKKIGCTKKSNVSLEWSKLKDIIFVCVSKLGGGRFSTASPNSDVSRDASSWLGTE